MKRSLSLLALALLPACAIGNRAEVTVNRNVSLGQELMDLQAAHEKGAITDEEYATMRQKLHDFLDLETELDLDVSDPLD